MFKRVFEEAEEKINVFIKDETGIMFSFHRFKRIKPLKNCLNTRGGLENIED
jgi:hypothetical protein